MLSAPANFKARFETTKGNFEIEAHRNWSPQAVDRLYQLIKSGSYNNIAIYRVIPNFVAQFGTNNDTLVNSQWAKYKITDEPVMHSNDSGTVAFARSGKDSRSNDIYINLKSNPRLDTIFYNDTKGFPVIAVVTRGMNVVQQFYNGYQEEPMAKAGDSIPEWNKYFKEKYPLLDYINKAYIIK
ncbi:peptidylprolyl isomerase [Foetidibacter luteolus]|uniref:peptidylprolyl isomerase n=1 Tax=Foetidibacter luteolus TaxID=2608880 RepID=UPI001A990352|nr:peptidylprolyl isomerase [Foetidibacter luteolus]